MRYFRRLPPLLRVAFLLGLLLPLASIAVLVGALISSLSSAPPQWSADGSRLLLIGVNLGMLGGACSFAVGTYTLRFRRPDGGTFPLASWQSQVGAIALVAALPLGALAIVLFVSPAFLADFLAVVISLLAAILLLAARVSAAVVSAVGGAGSRSR